MENAKTLRNVAIVLAIAGAVYLLPGGGNAARGFESALWVAFGIGIAYIAMRAYRERRMSLLALGERHRALLYGGVVLAVFALAARARMWETGSGELAWFVLVILVVYALMEVFRHSRSY